VTSPAHSRPTGLTVGETSDARPAGELRSLRSEVEGLRRLLEISREISSILDQDALLSAVLDSAITLTGAKRGMLLALADGRLKVILGRGSRRDSLDPETSRISETLAKKCIEENKVIPYHNLGLQTEYRDVTSIKTLSLYAAVCVPLRERGAPTGVLYLDSSTPGLRTSPHDIPLLEAFASQAAVSLLNARLMSQSEESRILLARENKDLRADARESNRLGSLLGQSRAMLRVFDRINLLKDAHVPVLIVGESGTGKELVARALHYEGVRRDEPFVPVNCAGLPGDLLDSLMFGHRKGTFTGALSDTPGLVEQSEGGTLFLDEIGDMPATLQVKLLRFLEAGEFRRVGEVELRRVRCRVVSATNQDLTRLMGERSFREDLYFRLAGVCLEIPPLRERREDIPILIEHFFARALEHFPRCVTGLTDSARDYLLHHPWPGNVRQLRQAIEGACALVPEGGRVGVEHMETSLPGRDGGSPDRAGDITDHAAQTGLAVAAPAPPGGEREVLRTILERHGWNMTRAARELGISRQHLYNRIRWHGLKRP
jgi:transcriptional regulator with GAF, ATPase, and Fis domain